MYDKDQHGISRRRFLATTLAGLAAASLPDWFVKASAAGFASAPRKIGPNDTIQLGLIGAGGKKGGYRQGLNDAHWIAGHPGAKVIAVCDVDRTHLEDAAASFGPDTAQFHDYRELLARPDIDAVVIGTPDHWHVPIAMAALRAGKDVYCEKPLTLTIDQGKQLVGLYKRSGRIFQTGSQQRSDARFRLACELVRNGRIGKVKTVEAHLPTGPTGGPFQPQPVPEDFDYDFWLGPAPEADYFPERCHGNFRWFLDYSGGMMTDWGAHHNDIAQWGLGRDRSGPVAIQGTVLKQPNSGKNAYDTFPSFNVVYTYDDGVELHTSDGGENGVQFNGENGWIFVSRSTIRASDQKLIDEPLPADAIKLYTSDDHAGNFLDGIRARKPCICDAEIGHRSASVCHLGNISMRLGGRKLQWDPKREQFKGDREANAMLKRTPRKKFDWA